MMRFRPALPAMAIVIALGSSGIAFAKEHDENYAKEAAAALSLKTTLTQAITSAERQTGGRVLKIAVENRKGAYAYKAKMLAKDGKLSTISMDPASGKVLRTEQEGLLSRILDREDRAEAAKAENAQTTLAAAIATAEKQTGGKVIEAGYDNENGQMEYHVAVAKDRAVHEVKIDSGTGKVIKVEAAGEGEQDED